MKKTIREWICINQTTITQVKVMLACPKTEVLFGDVQCKDGDKTVTVDDLVFAATYRKGGEFQPVTNDEFKRMDCTAQFNYIKNLTFFYCEYSFLYTEDAKIIDVDSKNLVVEDRYNASASLFDYLLDLDTKSKDLKGRCFA